MDTMTNIAYKSFSVGFLILLLGVGAAIGMGFAVQSLAKRKGYQTSFAWGFFFGVVALLYWGFVPVHPDLQAHIIAEGINRSRLAARGGQPEEPFVDR
ncbi:MAG TPA: hypothetical protein VN366_04885 [Feifaniaceae bacterium]|nr:hypothetical protein [Feifaniaceae bacterium]